MDAPPPKRGRGRPRKVKPAEDPPKKATPKKKGRKPKEKKEPKKPRDTVSEPLIAYREFMKEHKQIWESEVDAVDEQGNAVKSTVGEEFRKDYQRDHPEVLKGWYCIWVSEKWENSQEKRDASRKRLERLAREATNLVEEFKKENRET